jgi:Tol biopolymer transport system component
VANDYNHAYDVFVNDLGLGTMELESARQSALASVTPSGFSTFSAQPISQTGRYLAFASDADNVVAGDTNQYPDVFVRDLWTGSNTLVSVGLNGAGANGISFNPAINSGGRYVTFSSAATNLIAGDTNNSVDVFVRDLQTQSTYLVSADAAGTGEGNGDSYSPTVGSDGRYIMYLSKGSNLTEGSFTSGAENLFVRDRLLGANSALTTAGWICAAMTPDGQYVAFTDMAGSTAGKVYLWNAMAGSKVATNTFAAGVLTVALSPDGNQIAAFAGSGPQSLKVWNRTSNTVSTITSGYVANHVGIQFSANSRFLVFALAPSSSLTNQVYLYDVVAKTQTLVSHTAGSTTAADGSSDSPNISSDGRYVAYRSSSDNLVSGDTNGVPDIYLYDSSTGSNSVLTANTYYGTTTGNNRSQAPVFSGDGHTLVLRSWASDLASGDFNQASGLFGFAFLYTTITSANGTGTTINWTVLPSVTYTVQYKNSLADANWQTLPGSITVIGDQGYLNDPSPASDHRYYRIVGN